MTSFPLIHPSVCAHFFFLSSKLLFLSSNCVCVCVIGSCFFLLPAITFKIQVLVGLLQLQSCSATMWSDASTSPSSEVPLFSSAV